MNRIVITSYARTPLDSQKGREFQEMSIPELAVEPVKAAVARSGLGPSDVDGLVMGHVQSGTGEATNLGRHVALKAGLDFTTALAYTVDMVCGSGFQAVVAAMRGIRCGEGPVFIAAGAEMCCHKLIALPLSYMWTGIPKDGILLGGRNSPGDTCSPNEIYGVMYGPGFTVEKAARLYGVTREEADRFAFDSQRKMRLAQESGRFADEIIPFIARHTDRKGNVENITYDTDLHPKGFTTMEGLAKLRPAFEKDGVITAGNASGSNSGAAALVMMTEEEARRRGLAPIAYLNDYAFAGVDPTLMCTGPVPALQKLLKKTGLTFDDIDVLEINEAFAAQVVVCLKMLGFSFDSPLYERLNPNGGAVAIGHPLGCTGVRLVMTAAEELRRTGRKYAAVSACIGGGLGAAILLENAAL